MPLKITNGQLPEGWVEKKFGEIALLNRGHNPPKSKFIHQPKEGYVRFYQIRDGKSDNYEVYVPDTPQLHKVEPDDILMVAYRHIGRVFRGASGAFNVALCKITNKDRSILDDDYLFYIIPTEFVRGELMKQAERSLIPSMSVKHLAEIKIPVPPLSEQKRIVTIADQAFEGIDRAIANTKKNLINARELFESYLNTIFTQQGEKWMKRKLGELSDVQSGGTPSRSNLKYWGGEIAWYSSGELNDLYTAVPERHITDEGLANSNAKLFPKGSLLIGMYDTAALKMSVLDRNATFNQAIAGVKPNDRIDLIFILHAINFVKPEILSLRRGVRQKNLSLQKIKDIILFVPNLQEQQRVVRQLASLREETQRLEAIYQRKLAALNELKQSILQKAFTGELTTDTTQQATEAVKEVVAA